MYFVHIKCVPNIEEKRTIFLTNIYFKIRFLLDVFFFTIAENELKFSIFSNLQGLFNLNRFYKVGFLESDARTE